MLSAAPMVLLEDAMRTAELADPLMRHYKMMTQHVYFEIILDILELSVMARELRGKRVNLLDGFNYASTAIDLFLVKGPEAVVTTGCDLDRIVKAFRGELTLSGDVFAEEVVEFVD